ncbi:MAG: tetratricopeptide repeat-containing protein, partial [Myxococcota bacterium]|nr:tetratricopeptide repeat-containing protein [Myxococcota bacterium]
MSRWCAVLLGVTLVMGACRDDDGRQPTTPPAETPQALVDPASDLDAQIAALYVAGRYSPARATVERALALREEVLGPGHPLTATSLGHLGKLCQAEGDPRGARAHLERALAIRDEALGPEHPETIRSLHHLGALCQATGDLAAARPYLERALAARDKVLGPAHPETVASLIHLGALRRAMGDV